MEILSGMILLLQVVILIQIMLAQKRVLQRVEQQNAKIESIKNDIVKSREADKEILQKSEKIIPEMKQEVNNINQRKQEALINEVLSEVFS